MNLVQIMYVENRKYTSPGTNQSETLLSKKIFICFQFKRFIQILHSKRLKKKTFTCAIFLPVIEYYTF